MRREGFQAMSAMQMPNGKRPIAKSGEGDIVTRTPTDARTLQVAERFH